MRIAILNSNYVSINKNTRKGTEIFAYTLIKYLAKRAKQDNLEITAFASGDSHLPVPIVSVNYKASLTDKDIGVKHHKTFEMALVSKAFKMQDNFDLYHVNSLNGDVVLPFAPFVRKPIIVTMHGSFLEKTYNAKYLSLFENLKNIYFVSASNVQRIPSLKLNYIATIHHGIDAKRQWTFDSVGDDYITWAGRAIQTKGIDTVIRCIKKSGKKGKIFALVNDESPKWIRKMKEKKEDHVGEISFRYELRRHELAYQYQHSKLFLFPIRWEEPFGMVMIEAMACGTPVVAYAKGSVPEVVVDGETGFLINPSSEDIRGDFIIKKTGIEGLLEGIERIFSMPKEKYLTMRKKCRIRVEEYFTVENMVSQYIDTYKKAIALSRLV